MPPYSQLAYRRVEPAMPPVRATVVALHGHGSGQDALLPLARSLGPDLRIEAPAAARGVYLGMEVVGQTWFGGSLLRPEPASFGDSLAQLERFVHDVRRRAGEEEAARPWLLGYEQGATLSLSLAAIAPDLVAGVMAVCGCLPTFSDPGLLAPVGSSVPVLLVGDRTDERLPAAAIEATGTRLAGLGAHVATEWIAGAGELGPEVSATLRAWLDRLHVR